MKLGSLNNSKHIGVLTLVFSSIITLIISLSSYRNGLLTTPDSWAYWEGSISILEKNKYSYLGGEEILRWPPLFSIFLSSIQILFNQTGRALIYSMIFISILNVVIWGKYILLLFGDSAYSEKRTPFYFSLFFVAVFVPLCSAILLAQSLMLFFVGIIFIIMTKTVNEKNPKKYILNILIIAITITLGLLTHKSMIIFLCASIILLMIDNSRPFKLRVISCLIILLLSLAIWLMTSSFLNQLNSHSYQKPLYTPAEYLLQTINGLGYFFVSSSSPLQSIRFFIGSVFILSIIFPVLLHKKLNIEKHLIVPLLIIIVSYITLFILFNITWIDSKLEGRFLWYIPLAAVPIALNLLWKRKVILYAIVILFIGFSAVKSVRNIIYGAVNFSSISRSEIMDNSIRPYYFLSEKHSVQIPKDSKRILPPTFPWMSRWNQSKLPEEKRAIVRVVAHNSSISF